MAARAPHGSNQPPKIIYKKIYIEGHGGHHGGAWKVAYADFVTAMMAFFLLLWLLGATTEKQRKGIADYFAPTLVNMKQTGTGGTGPFGGASLVDTDMYPHRAAQTGSKSLTIPVGAVGGVDVGSGPKGSIKRQESLAAQDRANFESLHRKLSQRMAASPALRRLMSQVRFVPTREGLRIDLMDKADYSMFALGTTALVPDASSLVGTIAQSIAALPNAVMIRGHTDSVPYGDPRAMNNWLLSSGRAEATRRRLEQGGLPEVRFERIEGVADRESLIVKDPSDPRNRRVAITLLYRRASLLK